MTRYAIRNTLCSDTQPICGESIRNELKANTHDSYSKKAFDTQYANIFQYATSIRENCLQFYGEIKFVHISAPVCPFEIIPGRFCAIFRGDSFQTIKKYFCKKPFLQKCFFVAKWLFTQIFFDGLKESPRKMAQNRLGINSNGQSGVEKQRFFQLT